MTESKKLKADEIRSLMNTVSLWKRKGAVISRCYEFKDFLQAMKFVSAMSCMSVP